MPMNSKDPKNKETPLTGTLASVIILGIILISTWFGSWLLYLSR